MSSPEYFLGLDVGTTSVKAALTDCGGIPIGQESTEYPNFSGKYANSVEQSPDDWWAAAQTSIQSLLQKYPVASKVEAMAVSSQAPAFFCVDKHGQPLGNGWIWMDQRAGDICEHVLQPLQEEIIAYSGNRVNPYFMLPKILWQQRHLPELTEKIHCYLQVNGWIVYQLTNKYSIDNTHAALSQLLNIHRDCWERDFLKELGVNADKLPPMFAPKQTVGHLLPAVASSLGLRAGIPVAAGSTDGAAVALGLGLFAEGQIFEMSGQSSGFGIIMHQPMHQPKLVQLRHAVQDQWILKGSMSSTGGSLKWFRDCVDCHSVDCHNVDGRMGGSTAYAAYDEMAAKAPAGANGVVFLPYLAGERAPIWDSSARGIFFGLNMHTTKADLVRAILEGVAYGLKSILDLYPAQMQLQGDILGTGGGYRSALWAQIKADVLGRRISVIQSEFDAGAVGAAHLALLSRGGTIHLSAYHGNQKTYTPTQENAEVYAKCYRIFNKLYANNKELFALCCEIGG